MVSQKNAALSINGFTTKPFQIPRGVQQGDPISTFLFVIQMDPLCEMIDARRLTCGIKLAENKILPRRSCFTDNLLIIAKSDEAVVELYQIAEYYCRGSEPLSHAGKSVVILVKLHDEEWFSREIKIRTEEQTTTILGILMGANISRGQIFQEVIRYTVKRWQEWESRARSTQGHEAVASSIIIATLW